MRSPELILRKPDVLVSTFPIWQGRSGKKMLPANWGKRLSASGTWASAARP